MPISTLVAGNSIAAAGLNGNFALCMLTDTSRTVTVTHTYTATQTFTGGFTTGADATLGGHLLFTDATYDIGASGATRPRDFYLSRNAVIGGSLTGTTGAFAQAANSNQLLVTLTNTTSGTAAGVSQEWTSGTAIGRMVTLSQGFTPSAPYKASQTILLSVNGELALYSPSGNTVVYAGATTACATFSSTGVTVASGRTLTLTGVTVAGTPTWSSTQSLNISGVAATATALANARTIGGVSFDGTANITVATATGGFTVSGGNVALGTNSLTLTGSIASTGSRVTKGWFTDLEVTNAIVGGVTGNAATATAFQTARNINGTSFNGTADVTVTAAAGTLTGATLNATVTASSLTSVGTLSSLGVGAITSTGQFNVTVAGVSDQARVKYDTSNFLSVNVSSTGDCVVQANGSTGVLKLVSTGNGVNVGDTSQKIGFYGVTPIVRALLATGAGATVDNVITALQNLGLVKQS